MRHATHTGVPPDVLQIGVPAEHPLSCPVPAALSMHGTHMGADELPLQTPPAHDVPALMAVFVQAPLEIMSCDRSVAAVNSLLHSN